MGGGSPPVGVLPRLSPGGQLVPKARRQAMLPGSSPERLVLYGRPNRGAETSRFAVHDPEKWMPVFRQDHAPLAGVTRARKTNERLSPSSEHLTRRS